MAVNTTVIQEKWHTGKYSWFNLKVASATGISAGMPLVINGNINVTVSHPLPNNRFNVRVASLAHGAKIHAKPGHTVSG